MKSTALYDACVLYPQTLRDLLMYLAVAGLYRARWTDKIHDEWIENLLERRTDLTHDKLIRVRRLMDNSVPDALVVGYEEHIEALTLPDQDDRHVLAAAIHSRSDIIVTRNIRDFPQTALAPHGIEAIDPDAFIHGLLLSHPDQVVAALKRQRLGMHKPPADVTEYLALLERQDLPATVRELRSYTDEL